MIAIETNILVYAHRKDSVWHDAAYSAVQKLAEGDAIWAIPWPCLHEFYSVVTHPKVYRPVTTVEDAIGQIDKWLRSPTVRLLNETQAFWQVMRGVLGQGRIVDGNVHDAKIAALCLTHGVRELWSADRDFSRMPGLKLRNPLVS